ncbi:MAG: transglycosylase SLT domain-containing protein [Parcubacteria group bacterium]|nr:transglycosylase SLT domain-containing protein [Parcubacteria group bacterium]
MFWRFFVILLIFSAFPILLLFPILASAQNWLGEAAQGGFGLVSCSGPQCTICDLLKTGSNIINFFIKLAIPLAVIFIIYGGFMIMTAGPSESRAGEGRKVLTSAVVGIAIVLGSWLILNTVFLILNAQTPTPWNKIQCAASGPDFGKLEVGRETGLSATASDEIIQSAGGDAGTITRYDNKYEIQGGFTEIYSDSKSYVWNEDGSLTITFERGTLVTENGQTSMEGGEITIPAKDAEKIDFEEDENGFGGSRITVNEGDLTVSGAILSRERETSLDNGGMGSGKTDASAAPVILSQQTINNVNKYDSEIQMAALKYGVPPSAVKAVIALESNGDPNRQGPTGDYGIMQLLPKTATAMARGTQYANENITGEWLKSHPEASIELGTKYLAERIKANGGDVTNGYAGYNGGTAATLSSKNCPGSLRYQCGYDNNAHTVPNKGYQVTRDYIGKANGYQSQFRRYEQ